MKMFYFSGMTFYVNGDFFYLTKKTVSVIIIKNEPFVMEFAYIFHIIKYMVFLMIFVNC